MKSQLQDTPTAFRPKDAVLILRWACRLAPKASSQAAWRGGSVMRPDFEDWARIMRILEAANFVAQTALRVVADFCWQLNGGERRVVGMIESNLVAGLQDPTSGKPLTYGQSIRNGCVNWRATMAKLDELPIVVRPRRIARAANRPVAERMQA